MDKTDNLTNDSNFRFGLIFNMALDGILLLSYPNGEITDANQSILNQLGYSKQEIIGKKLWEIGILADHEKAAVVHNQILKYGFVRYEHLDLVKKTGEKLPVEFVCNSYNIDHSKVIQCNIRDLTQRRTLDIEKLAAAEASKSLQLRNAVDALSNVIEARDPFTAGHQKRVAHLVSAIAKDMGLTDSEIEGLSLASLVHDIGKISIPVEILTKPFALNPLEIAMLRGHAQSGFDILRPIVFNWPVAQYVLQHHERLDGSGYPNGLKGNEICMGARIIAVADTVEAMCSNRPYRPALGVDAALSEINNHRGTLYDSSVVDICLRLFNDKGYVFPEYVGHSPYTEYHRI